MDTVQPPRHPSVYVGYRSRAGNRGRESFRNRLFKSQAFVHRDLAAGVQLDCDLTGKCDRAVEEGLREKERRKKKEKKGDRVAHARDRAPTQPAKLRHINNAK